MNILVRIVVALLLWFVWLAPLEFWLLINWIFAPESDLARILLFGIGLWLQFVMIFGGLVASFLIITED